MTVVRRACSRLGPKFEAIDRRIETGIGLVAVSLRATTSALTSRGGHPPLTRIGPHNETAGDLRRLVDQLIDGSDAEP